MFQLIQSNQINLIRCVVLRACLTLVASSIIIFFSFNCFLLAVYLLIDPVRLSSLGRSSIAHNTDGHRQTLEHPIIRTIIVFAIVFFLFLFRRPRAAVGLLSRAHAHTITRRLKLYCCRQLLTRSKVHWPARQY